MLGGAILVALLLAQGQGPRMDLQVTLKDIHGHESAMYMVRGAPLEKPKFAPKRFPPKNQRWEFDWVTAGYGRNIEGRYDLRFRVFSQHRAKTGRDPSELAVRMALRMWGLLREKLRSEHIAVGRDLRLVDVYLAWGGIAGGEQQFAEEDEGGHRRKANTIYIYDMASFRQPLEMARELAHEYGHAVLPAVGGFGTPEEWANGYLGERLFLKWIAARMRAGQLVPEDAMGARLTELEAWVEKNVNPLVLKASSAPPDLKLLAGKGQRSMDAFLGLALYAEAILPPEVFARSLHVLGSTKAADYPNALLVALAEQDVELRIPPLLQGKEIWVPVGTARLEGPALLEKRGNWAKMQANSGIRLIAARAS